MQRNIFDEEHEMFRSAFRQFLDREVVPHADEWDKAGITDKSMFRTAGAAAVPGLQRPRVARRDVAGCVYRDSESC